ncbi:hypothetical protein HK104_008718 [Borealophlyctis nickersoniae]|nr:hypothetical protein HK104_008718 [Borealophlyctis nickersoniae]
MLRNDPDPLPAATSEIDLDIHLTKKTSHPIDPKRNEGAAQAEKDAAGMGRKANAHAQSHSTIKRNPITLVATAGLEAAIERCKKKVAKISAEFTQRTPAIIVLSQLDTRYFKGFEGPYDFFMELRVHAEGCQDYIARSRGLEFMMRSANVEVNLEPGKYTVYVKVTRRKNKNKSVEEMVVETVKNKPDKFLAIGENYMLAKAKGGNSDNPVFERLVSLAKKTNAQSGAPVASANANAEEDEDADEGAEEDEDAKEGADEEEEKPDTAAQQKSDDTEDEPTVVAGLRVYALDDKLTINARIGGQHVLPDPEDAQGDSKTEGDNPLAHEEMPDIGLLSGLYKKLSFYRGPLGI